MPEAAGDSVAWRYDGAGDTRYHAAEKSSAIMAVNLGDKAGHDGKTNSDCYHYSHKPFQIDNSVFTFCVHIFIS